MSEVKNSVQHSLRLERFIESHLPLANAMGVAINLYDGDKFIVAAPLQLNHNDKMTAFGGSLYCLCITNAIGMVFLKCFEQGINPDLVVSHAEIDYIAPVNSNLIESCCVSPGEVRWKSFFEKFSEKGKAGISLEAKITLNEKTAVLFKGRFAIIGESETTI